MDVVGCFTGDRTDTGDTDKAVSVAPESQNTVRRRRGPVFFATYALDEATAVGRRR